MCQSNLYVIDSFYKDPSSGALLERPSHEVRNAAHDTGFAFDLWRIVALFFGELYYTRKNWTGGGALWVAGPEDCVKKLVAVVVGPEDCVKYYSSKFEFWQRGAEPCGGRLWMNQQARENHAIAMFLGSKFLFFV